MDDIEYPNPAPNPLKDENKWRQPRKLIHLCAEYGFPTDGAHRAMTDCIFVEKVIQLVDDIDSQLANALLPRKTYKAEVSLKD